MYAKKTCAYSARSVAAVAADRGTREMYINAEMEYRAADSVIISAAERSCFEVPGIRDTRTMRITMMIVQRVVVPTDNAIDVI
jgi:hypothetical protein